jgi:hypothetical protein
MTAEGSWLSTERVPADIDLADGEQVRGDLHLQPLVAHRDGAETPLEMLNREEQFFPVSLGNGGGIVFVSKAQVLVVRVPSGPATEEPPGDRLAREVGLEVVLAGGRTYQGRARVVLPPTRTRALDYVNLHGPFFALRSDDGLLLIGRNHVRLVRPLD